MKWNKAMSKWIWRVLVVGVMVGLIQSPVTDVLFIHPFYDAVNAVVGDVSYAKKFGVLPDQNASEHVRIQTHLAYVEDLLREREVDHLTPEERDQRNVLLDHLKAYWQAGQFPQRTDTVPKRRPCFIDEGGNVCAVGYLIEQSVGRNLAERINEQYQYAYLWDMQDDALTEWVGASGFRLKELSMVQPAYQGPSFEYILVPNGSTPCTVDFEDFIAFVQAFNSSPGDINYDIRADTNSDGIVNFPDFIAFAQTFGRKVTCYEVSGLVLQADSGLEDVVLSFVELDERWDTMTDSLGVYSVKDVPWGDFRLVPQKIGFVFSPDTLLVRVAGSVTGQNFEATPVQSLLVGREITRE